VKLLPLVTGLVSVSPTFCHRDGRHVVKVRQICAWMVTTCFALTPGPVLAQNLGGGRSPQIAIGWIVIMLFLCIGIAVLVIYWIKLRHERGAIPIRKWFPLPVRKPRPDAFQIVETRRAGSQTDVTLIRWRGREFLLAISAGQLLLLGEQEGEAGSVTQGDQS